MGFVKVAKSSNYFSRYQVKFRRRREAKTDYAARQKLIIQDKNKYKTPKYRMVVRFSNRDVTTQIVTQDMDHDVVIAQANSYELRRYGITTGLTNWAATYATGLLLARRVNAKFNLDYEGTDDVNGEEFLVEASLSGAAPFKALLDVGLKRTTTGAKVFAAMKGACDGGLYIPHNAKRFPGSSQGKDWEAQPEVTRNYIFGGNVADYMNQLQEENPEKYAKVFSQYIKAGVSGENLEELYTNAHAAIRANPTIPRGALELGKFGTRAAPFDANNIKKVIFNRKKRSNQQRKARIAQKLTAAGVVSAPKLIVRQNKK